MGDGLVLMCTTVVGSKANRAQKIAKKANAALVPVFSSPLGRVWLWERRASLRASFGFARAERTPLSLGPGGWENAHDQATGGLPEE